MQYTLLGRTGMEVSRLCLGTMTFSWSADEATSFDIMDAAVANGINFFDTADVYSYWASPQHKGGETETIMGNWFKTRPRDKIILASKARGKMWEGSDGEGLGKAHLTRAIEDSLRRLQTDYLDLYQAHHPDPNTPAEETLETFDALIKSGKVRAIGCSNYPAPLLRENLDMSAAKGFARYDTLQPHYSLLHRAEFEAELMALCGQEHIAVIPYSPLAAGFLTGKYKRDDPAAADTTRGSSGLIQRLTANERAWAALDVVREIALERGSSMTHVALAWMLANPVITSPIIGARSVPQLEEAIGAVDLPLLESEIERLNQASAGF
jgi:aryl-alcohol dehydrogenase-like predicted oxidoreductase